LLPTLYDDDEKEYWQLLEHVTLWDVAVERQVEVTGPDAAAFTQLLTCQGPLEVRGGPVQVRAAHRAGRRHRERPRAAAPWGEPLLALAGGLRRAAVREGGPGPGRPGGRGARAGCLAAPGPGPEVQGGRPGPVR